MFYPLCRISHPSPQIRNHLNPIPPPCCSHHHPYTSLPQPSSIPATSQPCRSHHPPPYTILHFPTPSTHLAAPPYYPNSILKPKPHPKTPKTISAAARRREEELDVQKFKVEFLGVLGVIFLMSSMFQFNKLCVVSMRN